MRGNVLSKEYVAGWFDGEGCFPYLHEKKYQVQLALEFRQHVEARPQQNKKLTEEEWEYRSSVALAIKEAKTSVSCPS